MYKTVIIGAGSIGALKPDAYDSPDTENILTHAHACYKHPDIELTGIIDKNSDKAIRASNKWNCMYATDTDILSDFDHDIFIIATPTETHKQILLDIIQYKPKFVIAEKPFCSNAEEAREVIEAYKQANIPMSVDYIRNYDYQIRSLIEQIKLGYYGQIFSCICWYVRGLRHEGSHAINLFNKMFGEFIDGKIYETGNCFPDRDINDRSCAVHLIYQNCQNVIMIPVDSRTAFNVFNIEIMTEKGKIILSEHGKYIEFYPRIPEPTYGDYNTLSAFAETRIKTEIDLIYIIAEAEAGCFIKNQGGNPKSFYCTPEDALKVHEIIEYLR